VQEPRLCLLLELVLAAWGAAAYARPLYPDIPPWGDRSLPLPAPKAMSRFIAGQSFAYSRLGNPELSSDPCWCKPGFKRSPNRVQSTNCQGGIAFLDPA
jgi:hypothetical protein